MTAHNEIMKKSLFSLYACFCLVLLFPVHAHSEIEEGIKIERGVKCPPAGVILAQGEAVLKRINAFCVANGLKPWDIDIKRCGESIHDGTDLQGDLLNLYEPTYLWIQFQPSSGRIVKCFNSKLDNSLTSINATTFREFDEQPKPKWTPDYAEKLARGFVVACCGEFSKNVGKPHVWFYQQKGTYNDKTKKARYRVPYWWVTFPRIDKDGYEFEEERIEVYVFEDAGPYFLQVIMPSRYDEVKGKTLTLEQATPLAVAHAHELMNRGGLSEMFKNGTIKETPVTGNGRNMDPKLEIVKPNHIIDLPGFPSMKDIDIHARLAWVLWFDWTSTDPTSLQKRGVLCVWVDAHTGKLLGGHGF